MAHSGVQKRKPEAVPRERTLYTTLLNSMEEAFCDLNKRPFTSTCIASPLPVIHAFSLEAEFSPTMHEALGSIPSAKENQKNR